MINEYIIFGMIGVFLLNAIASVISKNKKIVIYPAHKLGKAVCNTYLVLISVWAVLDLFLKFDSQWFLSVFIGGQFIWQIFTAIKKLAPSQQATRLSETNDPSKFEAAYDKIHKAYESGDIKRAKRIAYEEFQTPSEFKEAWKRIKDSQPVK